MKLALSCVIALALIAAPAWADLALNVQLQPSIGLGDAGGDPVIFSGTITDLGTDPGIYLNDISVSFTGATPSLTPDPTGQPLSVPNTFFSNNFIGSLIGDGLPADDSYFAPVFEIYIAPGTAPGDYQGTISILGGYNNQFETNLLGQATFTVVVAPEPGALGLTMLALAGIFARRRWMS